LVSSILQQKNTQSDPTDQSFYQWWVLGKLPVVGVRKKTAKFYSIHPINWILAALPKEETNIFDFWERDAFNMELQNKFDLDSGYIKYNRLRSNINFDYYIRKVIKKIQ
jgi:hypothetical protein